MLILYRSAIALAILVLLPTAIYVGKRYPKPGTGAAVLLLLGMMIWDFGYFFSLGVEMLPAKLFWTNFQYLGSVCIPPLWFLVIWRYTQHELKSRLAVASLFLIPAATAALAWTNQYHELLWTGASVSAQGGLTALSFARGPWWLVDVLFSYILFTGGLYLLVRAAVGLPRVYKQQAGVIVTAALVPLFGNISYISGLTNHVDPAPLTFSFTGIVVAFGVSHYRLFGVVPVAKSKLMDEMNLGMIVIDREGIVLSMNPAALDFLDLENYQAGRKVEDVIKNQEALLEYLQNPEPSREEISLASGGELHHYDFKLTPLASSEEYTSGWLAQLYRITSRVKAEEELKQVTVETMEALARTVEAKDDYTREHLERVEEFALALGEEFGIAGERFEQLRFASVLHDIGKVRIPDRILQKREELSEEEEEIMRAHTEIGEAILSQVSYLDRAAEIVGQHHERYDGTGYPKGLEGDEVVLEARILGVVDAYDAMRSDRPYRGKMDREAAIENLLEGAGSQFDPEVVDKFVKLLRRQKDGD